MSVVREHDAGTLGNLSTRRRASWNAIVRHFTVLAAGEGTARLVGVAAMLLMARRLTPSDFGVIMLGFVLTAWFSLSVDAGTETVGIREIARAPERLREIAEPVLGLRLALCGAAVAIFAPVAWAMGTQPGDRGVLLLFAIVLPATAINLRTMVVGAGGATALGAANVGSQIAFLLGVVMLVHGADDLAWVPALRGVVELGYATVILLALRPRFGAIRPRVDLRAWRLILRQSLPLLANNLASITMFSSGVLLIGLMVPREQVGLYAAAHRPVVFGTGVTGLLLVSFLSSYSALAGRDEAVHVFRRTVWLATAAVPGALVLSAAARTVLGLAYGPAYVAAAPVFALLIWVMPILLVAGPYGIALLATHHQGRLLRHHLIGAAFTVVGTIAGVATVGITGAAIAALAAQALVAVLNYRASVALGVAPTLEVVLLGRQSMRSR